MHPTPDLVLLHDSFLSDYLIIHDIEYLPPEQLDTMVPTRDHPHVHIIKQEKVLLVSYECFVLFYQQCFDLMHHGHALPLVSRVLLTLNPELNTAINCRYRLFQKNMFINSLKEENSFMQALLFRSKKASAAFAYRFQVLISLLQNNSNEMSLLLDQESDFVYRYLHRHPRNYYISIYRIKLVEWLAHNYDAQMEDHAKQESHRCMVYTAQNPFDNSQYHYLLYLSKYLGPTQKQEMLEWAQQLLQSSQCLYSPAEQHHHFSALKQFIVTLS